MYIHIGGSTYQVDDLGDLEIFCLCLGAFGAAGIVDWRAA